jgi:hypothetical protein
LCGSCGRDEDDLDAVRRVYVVPQSWDTEASRTVEDGVELWCFTCRSMYPHEPAEA